MVHARTAQIARRCMQRTYLSAFEHQAARSPRSVAARTLHKLEATAITALRENWRQHCTCLNEMRAAPRLFSRWTPTTRDQDGNGATFASTTIEMGRARGRRGRPSGRLVSVLRGPCVRAAWPCVRAVWLVSVPLQHGSAPSPKKTVIMAKSGSGLQESRALALAGVSRPSLPLVLVRNMATITPVKLTIDVGVLPSRHRSDPLPSSPATAPNSTCLRAPPSTRAPCRSLREEESQPASARAAS